MTTITRSLHATKIPEYLLEPITTEPNNRWEGHHATNPTVLRLSSDPRVFMAYRAGGEDDYYRFDVHNVWGSHMGLAILDERGEKVVHRLPLPIFKLVHDVPLPQTVEEYQAYMKGPNADRIVVLHDFRLYEREGYLYLIYHEGPIHDCDDCICRMTVADFLAKVADSVELMTEPVTAIEARWHDLWWAQGVWQPCGINGTNHMFPTYVNKGDIVFFDLADGSLQMCHRPMADVIAVLNTGANVYAEATPDGITKYGVVEQNIRPGYLDNSHLGNNGTPTRAKIGDVDVYVDVVHGCHDQMYSEEGVDECRIFYYPYFRVKDYETGEQLYYSEGPVLDYDETWRAYAEEGRWVSSIKHLLGVMFTGGQVEARRGKNGLDDEFYTYSGLGDTAIGRARFTLRELLPDHVIADIQVRKAHQAAATTVIPNHRYTLEDVHGWQWSIENDPQQRTINVMRELDKDGHHERAAREINSAPGYFDADALYFDGTSVSFVAPFGWVVIYRGVRWDEIDGQKTSQQGYGVLILDHKNPEKVLYRSTRSIAPPEENEGWTVDLDCDAAQALLKNFQQFVPNKVLSEIRRLRDLEQRGLARKSQMIAWLRQKAGLEPIGVKPGDVKEC